MSEMFLTYFLPKPILTFPPLVHRYACTFAVLPLKADCEFGVCQKSSTNLYLCGYNYLSLGLYLLGPASCTLAIGKHTF